MQYPRRHLPALSTLNLESVGFGLGSDAVTSPTSGAWPSANRALYVPFVIDVGTVVVALATITGATSSGNIDVGIYNASGTRLVSSGSTAQSASTNTLQTFDITDTALAPGYYFIGVAMDNTTGTLFRTAPANIQLESWGVKQEASAFVLPATATFASPASNYLPQVGWTERTTI